MNEHEPSPGRQSLLRLGVLAAAGRGTRAGPRTVCVPKVLLEVGGKPLLVRNLEILRDQVGIRDIVVLVGHLEEQVRGLLGDGSRFDVAVRYVTVSDPGVGLAHGLGLARGQLAGPFMVILGDELYLDSNHAELKHFGPEWEATCAYQPSGDPQQIARNYEVMVTASRVTDLMEKPQTVRSDKLGLGTFVFRESIFDAIERTAPNVRSGRVELVDALRTLVRAGKPVHAFHLRGDYVNVNSIEDRNNANHIARSRQIRRDRVSIVIPAWNEAESIGQVVRDFLPHGNEVVVADNQSTDDTAGIARNLGARVFSRPLAGYGEALRYGMDQATGDLLVLVEGDYSFRARDLGKFLEYVKDADLVVGTRTMREMIEQGTNMRGIVRWANIAVGKFIEILWWNHKPRLTDVGCTYRAIWRDVYQKVRPRLLSAGPEFAPEMMIEVLRQRGRVVEIPVSYHPRSGGASKHSAGLVQLARTAMKMLRLIVRKRLGAA
jgi:dTDP-glucose pyrophosphorylase